MPRRAYISQLPDDLVAGILARLPPRQVARVRLVCRWWNALTTGHDFLRASFSWWRRHGHAGHDHRVAGFFFYHVFGLIPSHYVPLAREADEEAAAGDRFVPDSFIPSTRSADPGSGSVDVDGSCNGLLLLRCKSNYYVCNPLTKKLAPIVQPREVSLSLCSLAFDPSKSHHYKVIALAVADMYSIHVYSSETRSWQMAIHSDHSAGLFQGLHLLRGVFWNGSVVWIVAHSLVRFMIEEKHITKMPMPSRKKDWICAYVGESGGHLQMIGYTKKDMLTACFDILEMQENTSEWSVLYHIDLSRVKELYPNIEWPTWDTRYHQHKIIDRLALSPIYVIRGTGKTGQHGVLVFSIPGKIMSYNMEDQEISVVKEIASPYPLEQFWYNFYAYSPSLFSF